MSAAIAGDTGVQLRLCTCCAVWEANRDASGCEDACDPANNADAHPHDLMGDPGVASLHVTLAFTDDGLDQDDFSDRDCDGCGTRLAGTRIHATGWVA